MNVQVSAGSKELVQATLLGRLLGMDEEDLDALLGTADEDEDGRVTYDDMAAAVSAEDRNAETAALLQRASDAEALTAQRLSFHLKAEVTEVEVTAAHARSGDGSEAGVVRASVRRTVVEIDATIGTRQPKQKDPLLVDLDGDGFETSGYRDGVGFDIDADGAVDTTSFAHGGDAFLVLDRNANGRVDDGAELFGDHHGAADGIAELSRFDDDANGLIDVRDAVWSRLALWRDADHDGNSAGETVSLADAGFTGIDLTRQAATGRTTGGDEHDGEIRFVRADGTAARATDAYLQYT